MVELAAIAGVSVGTVSRALRDSPRVREDTKKRIRALAEEHNFKVNQKARNFRLGRTGVVSVVLVQEESMMSMSDPFFLEILGSIAGRLAEHDLDVLLATPPIPNVLDLVDSRVFEFSDGVIFIGQGRQHSRLNKIATLGKPVVVWGAPMPDQRYLTVGSDNFNGGYLATAHLLEQGRRRIAFFGGDGAAPETYLRKAGYVAALNDGGHALDETLLLKAPNNFEGLDRAFSEILTDEVVFDALVCSSDLMAVAAISAIEVSGRRVPKDIAVVGYDDITMARFNNPSLTTIRQDMQAGGRALVERLIGQMNGLKGESLSTILPSKLVVRGSSR